LIDLVLASLTRIGHRYLDNASDVVLDTWFPRDGKTAKRSCLAQKFGLIRSDVIEVVLEDDSAPPKTTEDVYLRFHLLSECARKPNSLSLEGMFDLLPVVAWTSAGPVLPERVDELRAAVAAEYHQLMIPLVDKIPRMIDYVVPPGVRIGDADRVRLGAHLAPGTTVMHEGFVNFNAGSTGSAMIEGRVTPGVTVGEGSDVGAGSSIQGTLSGGGKLVNSIGRSSLLGANGGIGISLGDNCIVEAGLYVTAGTKVKLLNGDVVSARELSGQSGLLFRRNSQSGGVEAISSKNSNWGGLNPALHKDAD